MLTVSTKTEVLLQKLTFGISVKGHAREHQLTEKAATQTAEGGDIIYLRENVSVALAVSFVEFSSTLCCSVLNSAFNFSKMFGFLGFEIWFF